MPRFSGYRLERPTQKEKLNKKDLEVIGAKDAVFIWHTFSASGKWWENSNKDTATEGLDQTTFDVTTYAGGAEILLTNNSGESQTITAATIRAKPVFRLSGGRGFIHDSFYDAEGIYKDGENEFRLANNYIVTKAQVEKLAELAWKEHKEKRHIYGISIPGECFWYEPGRWYTLQIGGAGEREYIDSVCECYSVDVEKTTGELGYTLVMFREVYQNFTFDSSALARFMASGLPSLSTNLGHVTVANEMYPDIADYYCDGTDDQTEIQAAINHVASKGGGVVDLTDGTFYITAALELADNVTLQGRGDNTIIEKNANDYAIECVGSSGSEKTGAQIRNLKVTRDSSDTNLKSLIFFNYADDSVIDSVTCLDAYANGIYVSDCDNINIRNNLIKEYMGMGIRLATCTGIVIGNIVDGNNSNPSGGFVYGIYIVCTNPSDVLCANNTVKNLLSSGATAEGIHSRSGHIIGNTIHDIKGGGSTEGTAIGINANTGDKNKIESNNIYNISCYGLTLSTDDLQNPTGIFLNNSDHSIVQNNRVEDALYIGIGIDTDCEFTRVMNNYSVDCGQLIVDGNCESTGFPYLIGDGNSQTTNCYTQRDTVDVYEGSYSLLIRKTSTDTAEFRFCDNNTKNDMHGLVPGQTYKLSAKINIPTGGGVSTDEAKIIIAYTTDSGGSWTEVPGNPSTTPDEYGPFETTNVAIPENAVGAMAFVRLNAPASTDEGIYIDNVRLQPIDVDNEHDNNFDDNGDYTIYGSNSWQEV